MKVNVILKKEDIDELKLNENHIAIVLDVLFATTTIVTCLANGAKDVYPVLDAAEALELAKTMQADSPLIAGEKNGKSMEGFIVPTPQSLGSLAQGKSVILATTNGTVAIRKVAAAKRVFIASLLNGAAITNYIHNHYDSGYTIHVICSGSAGRFCLEDFFGAGCLVSQLDILYQDGKLSLSDSAVSAKLFYESHQDEASEILAMSKVGGNLIDLGLIEELSYSSQQDSLSIIPELIENRVIYDK